MEDGGSSSTILLKVPSKLWIGAASKEFPELKFEVLAFLPVSHDPFIGNSLISVRGPLPGRVLDFIKEHETLLHHEVMSLEEDELVLKTETLDQYLLKCIIRNHVLVRFPVLFEDGTARLTVLSTHDSIDRFITDLEDHGLELDLKAIGKYSTDPYESKLTARQFEVFTQAKEAGYYDTPRKLTLTELAQQLGLAKSSLSSMMQRIHKTLLG